MKHIKIISYDEHDNNPYVIVLWRKRKKVLATDFCLLNSSVPMDMRMDNMNSGELLVHVNKQL